MSQLWAQITVAGLLLAKAAVPGQPVEISVESPDRNAKIDLDAGRLATLILRFESTSPASSLRVSDVRFDAGMPSHAHGMTVRPVVVDQGGGVFRVEGVKLHMPGTWEIGVAGVVGSRAVTLSLPYVVPGLW